MKTQLIEKIKQREAVIGIVGLGYVGLPLMLRYVEEKYKVIGFDIDQDKVTKLNAGKSYIEHITDDAIKFAVDNKFEATTDYKRIKDVDAIILCVPTPLNTYREPDLSYVIDTTESIAPHIRPGHVVSLESTTYPGTTDEELVPRLSNEKIKLGQDVFIVYSPEREDPGRQDFNTKTTPKVCGGVTEACLEVGVALYEVIVDRVVPVSSCRAAEMTKLLENIHRSVNIGLVNEMKIVADKMGIDIHEVIDAASTKPFGFVAYRPGPGLGGHCIPIDPFYLTWKARQYDVHTRFIELAGEINNSMTSYVMKKIGLGLNDRKVTINGAKILILGIAYKKNVDDVRESPSIKLMEKLRKRGADVSYSDPHLPEFPKMREHSFDLKSVALTAENLAKFDCVVLTTDHDKFDYAAIIKHARFIVDTRGKFRERADKIMRA